MEVFKFCNNLRLILFDLKPTFEVRVLMQIQIFPSLPQHSPDIISIGLGESKGFGIDISVIIELRDTKLAQSITPWPWRTPSC